MPTNLPVEAKRKWNEVSTTRDPKRRLQLLQEFLSLVPKHKGTERLRAQVKTKMAAIRRDMEEERRRRKAGGRGRSLFVEKEGAAQIALLGMTNTGRSSLLSALTNAKVKASEYSFATREPVPGMLTFEDLQFQIIETPALVKGAAEGKAMGQLSLALARNADGLMLMVDLSKDPRSQLSLILDELEKARVLVRKLDARIEIERKHVGAGLRIVVMGRLVGFTLKDVEKLLKSFGLLNAVVKIYGEATIDDVEDSIFGNAVFRPALVLANKLDVEGAKEKRRELERMVGSRLKVVPVSCKTGLGLKSVGPRLFRLLNIIRVYTREPTSRAPSLKPFILKRGSTVADLTLQIHSDFFKRFSYARVWSKRYPFSPRKAGLSFVLEDKEVVEVRLR